jgi:hypothetical protein
MIHHRNKQIKEQRCATRFHLQLHRAAALEGVSTADDQCKVMGAQLGVGCWRVGVGVAGGGQDSAALDVGGEALLLEGKTLEVGELVAVGGAL